MDRRRYLAVAGGAAFAGCLSEPGVDAPRPWTTPEETLEGTLTVATYDAFVDAPSTSPADWLEAEFERRHPGVTLDWSTPENALNHHVLRRQEGAPADADVYVGLKVPELVRVDRELSKPLFEAVDTGRLSNYDHVESEAEMDPDGRVLPLFRGYCSLVYDGTAVDAPGTLDALADPAYRGQVTVPNPQTDDTGLYFLLWTVQAFGEGGYLDFWRRLVDNDLHVLRSWGEVYNAFTAGETAVVASYSNDRVYAKRAGQDLAKHRVAFPGRHGYAYRAGMGRFATTDRPELATAFMDFMLGPGAQGKLAEQYVAFPVTDHAEVPDVFAEYAKEPPEPVAFSYDELAGSLRTWRRDWAELYADT